MYHFGIGAPPILVYFSGDWDVHWGYGGLTHGHMNVRPRAESVGPSSAVDPYQSHIPP